MRLAAVVILYNIEDIGIDSVILNIRSYEDYVEKIYLIDNSLVEHPWISESLKNAVYVLNKNIGGIGGAQNIGCRMALADGYDWVMTMDTDTIFDSPQIKKYLQSVENFIRRDSFAVSYSLRAENLTDISHWSDKIKNIVRPFKRRLFGERKKLHSWEYKERCIASANIIKLSAWETIGGYNENLFIDQVDYEFCYRLIDNGFKIVKFNDLYMNQHFGEAHGFTLFRKHYAKYSSFRYYHCIRNSYVVRRKYPKYKKFYDKYLRDLFFDNCVNSVHAIRNLLLFLKARKDSKLIYL